MKTIRGERSLGMILTVDPSEFSPDNTYTFEQDVAGRTITWTNIRPQREEDGALRVYLDLYDGPCAGGPLDGQRHVANVKKLVVPVQTGQNRGRGNRGFGEGTYLFNVDARMWIWQH